MSSLSQLTQIGQSVWLDYIRKDLLTDGELKRAINAQEITGITSNPDILNRSIGETDIYDDRLHALLKDNPRLDEEQLYDGLVIPDIQAAADLLQPVYERTEGADGYVSIEVSPHVAHDISATIHNARVLALQVDRDNLMIKVPGTKEGFAAMQQLIGEGISVNATLLFSIEDYEKAVEAFLGGLEIRRATGGDITQIASVASIFNRRIDQLIDKLLPAGSPLKGTIAIANARLAYQRFKELIKTERFLSLQEQGAQIQRICWASTGVKNCSYRDVHYVESLIGPGCAVTMPLETLHAFRDHGKVEETLEADLHECANRIRALEETEVDFEAVTDKLKEDGVLDSAHAYNNLLESIDAKREEFTSQAEAV